MNRIHLGIFAAIFSVSAGNTQAQDTTSANWKNYRPNLQLNEDPVDTTINTVPTFDPTTPGKATVYQDPRIQNYANLWMNHTERAGFRILIFRSKNSAEAKEAKTKYLYKYEDQKAYNDYLQPYFQVTVGDFRTRLEAEEYLNTLRDRYPGAYIVKSEIAPAKL